MEVFIPSECIECPFNYDTISCRLNLVMDEYGETADEGKPEHCNIKSFIIVFNNKETSWITPKP